MKLTLKPLGDQVIVIVGASSGIGLATAQIAASSGARVLMAARNRSDLAKAVDGIRRRGGRAVSTVADVSDATAVDAIAEAALRGFGRIDTWINAAAVGLYGRHAPAGGRHLLGCRAWLPHGRPASAQSWRRADHRRERRCRSGRAAAGDLLRRQTCGERVTDTLRMEVEAAGWPIAVSLVKPASVNTPLFEKSKSLLGVEPQPVPPVYAPEVVARAILDCAQRPVRDLIVGSGGAALSALGATSPRVLDRYMESRMFDQQKTDRPLDAARPHNLYDPVDHDGGLYGHTWSGRVRKRSAYTSARLHPTAALAAVLGGIALLALFPAGRGATRAPAALGQEPMA